MKKLILFLSLLFLSSSVWATNYCTDSHIVGCYPTNTGSGTSLIDSSTHMYNGTFESSGHPLWQTVSPSRSYLTQSVAYSSASDNINLAQNDSTTFYPAQAMSFVSWIYPTSCANNSSGFVGRITSRTGAAEALFAIGNVNSDTAAYEFTVPGSTTNLIVVTANNTCVVNTWTHVVVTWDGSTTATNVHIYLNGAETTYQTQTNGSGLYTPTSTNLYIGNNYNLNRNYAGYMTETAYFSRVLSSSDVTSIYTNGLLQSSSSNPFVYIYNAKIYDAIIY